MSSTLLKNTPVFNILTPYIVQVSVHNYTHLTNGTRNKRYDVIKIL